MIFVCRRFKQISKFCKMLECQVTNSSTRGGKNVHKHTCKLPFCRNFAISISVSPQTFIAEQVWFCANRRGGFSIYCGTVSEDVSVSGAVSSANLPFFKTKKGKIISVPNANPKQKPTLWQTVVQPKLTTYVTNMP